MINTINQEKKFSNKQAILIYLIVALFLVFEMAVQVAPSVMAPNLMRDLNLGTFDLGLMSGFYFYTYAIMQIPSGLLFDRFKPKFIIIISILVCTLGTLLFGLATNFYLGCLSRLLTGLGSAFAFVSVLFVASDIFEKKYFALMTGITQMLAAFGAMLGQMPISFLVHHLGWQNTMFSLSGMGLGLATLVWFIMNYDGSSKQNNIECFSNSLSIKNSLKIIIFKPQTWYIALYALLLWAPMSGFASLWGVQFLIKVYSLNTTSAAFYCSLMWLGLAIFSPLLGIFATSINNKWLPLVLSACMGSITFGLILGIELPYYFLVICLLLAGGACAGQSLSFALIQENNPKSVKATAFAFNNMAIVISGAIFQPLIGFLISKNHLNEMSPTYPIGDYKFGLIIILIAYIFAMLISILLIRKKRKYFQKSTMKSSIT